MTKKQNATNNLHIRCTDEDKANLKEAVELSDKDRNISELVLRITRRGIRAILAKRDK